MNTSWIAYASEIVVGLSAIFVAILALLGLRTWRKELIGKAKFEAARNVLLLARNVTRDFTNARGLMTWAGESADRISQETETPELTLILNEAYARNKRLQPLNENLQKLQQAAWEAEIILGEAASKGLSEAMEDYSKCWAELSVDLSEYFLERIDQANGRDNIDPQFLRDLKKTIYGLETDDFGKRIQNAQDKLSSVLKDYVK